MPDRSMGGGSYNSGYGSASKSTSSSSSARSSTTQAAAAARAAASRAASTAATRSSGAGASLGSFSSGAAVNARTGTSNSAASRNMSSGGGYGASRPASANVNAAAARAAMSANQRSAGIAQSAAGKGNPYGANQVVSKGVNLSAGDYLRAGYGEYKNPTARVAMAARPNTTVAKKGVNLSAGDLLSGGYGQYRQAPSAQSTPQAAANGWRDLAGIQRVLSQSAPTVASIVAGDPVRSYGIGGYTGEISDYATRDIMGQDAIGNTLSAALSRAEIKKDITDRVPSKAQPTAVAGYQNPARAFPARNVSAPVQVASYQNPAGNMTASLQSPMAGQSATFRSPASAAQYNAAMGGLLSAAPTPTAGPPQTASGPSLWESIQSGASSLAQTAQAKGAEALNAYQQGSSYVNSLPGTPEQKAAAIKGYAEGGVLGAMGGYLSGGFKSAGNKVTNTLNTATAPLAKYGNQINAALGGRPDGGGVLNMQGAGIGRDVSSTEADKFQTAGEGDQITNEQISSLSAPQKAEFDRLVASGMSRTEAYYRALGYTSPATQQPKTIAYPEYYSKWAGLPTGTYA